MKLCDFCGFVIKDQDAKCSNCRMIVPGRESLLTTPVARSDLMWGKWLAVAIIASASVLLQLVGLFVAIRFLAAGILTPPTVSIVGWILFVVTILLFAIFVVAVEMAVAMRARSVKEAGSTLGPMVILFIGPALFAQFVNMENIEEC